MSRKNARGEAQTILQAAQPPEETGAITEEHLAGLPAPVQRYLRYAQVIGKEPIRSVRLKQKGSFRTSADGKWLPLIAEQYFTVNPPAFLWYGAIQAFPLVTLTGRDVFFEGRGSLKIKLLSLVTVAEESGPETDQGELIRYLSETMWFPTAWLSECLRWEAIDDTTARASLSHGGTSVSVDVHFDAEGQISHIAAQRYWEEDGNYELKAWWGVGSNYEERNGFVIPTQAEAIWKLPEGDFSYFRGEVTEIEYDVPEPYGA